MGRNTGRPRKGQLVDMGLYPPDDPGYEHPPLDECEEYDTTVPLDYRSHLRVVYHTHEHDTIVRFAIMQNYVPEAKMQQVARVDTCHGVIHRHQLNRRRPDDDQGAVHAMVRVPPDGALRVIDEWYSKALDLMHNGWRENLRQWGGDYE